MIKTILSISMVVCCSLAFVSSSEAAQRKIQTSQAAPEYSSSSTTVSPYSANSSVGHWGLGFAAAQNIVGAAGPQGQVAGTTALTGLYEITRDDWVQGLFTIPSTSPFGIMVGGLYKHTVAESGIAGFHIGGGFGMGDVSSTFIMNLVAVAGLHLSIPGAPQVVVHLDGGPAFNLTGSNTNFQIGAVSPALGATVAYLF